ncbi:PAS domain S-box protein [Desulfamplus magnetovallimortis]|nr:PAS domain S-box protein [Desulfamplus magnetovallimortis]
MHEIEHNRLNLQKSELRLREKAEAILKKGFGAGESIPRENVDKLVTELQLHQVELEIQNEELRNAQKEIERSRDRFSTLFNNAPVGYIVMNQDPMIIDVNQTICEMLTKKRSDLIRKPFSEFIEKEDRPIFLSRFKAFFKNPEGKTMKLRLTSQNETFFYAELKGRIQQFDKKFDGNLSDHILISISDITEREEILKREAHIKSVLSAIRKVNQLIVNEKEPVSLIRLVCKTLTQSMGYYNAWIALLDEKGTVTMTASSEFKEDSFIQMQRHLDRIEHPPCMKQALEKESVIVIKNPSEDCPGCPLSHRYAARAGLTRRIESHGKIFGVLSVSVLDIYAFDKEAQDLFGEMARDLGFALHKIEADAILHYYSHILATLPQPMAFLSKDYRYIAVNDVYKEFYELEKEQITGKRPADFVGQDVFEREIKPHLDRCLAGETITYETEITFSGKGKCWMEMTYVPYRNEKEIITGLVSHGLEITAIKQSEKRLTAIIDNTPVGICITDENGIFEQVNPAYCRLYKYDESELIGKHFTIVVPEKSRKILGELHDSFIQGESELRGEWEVVDKNGSLIAIIADAARVIGIDGRPRKVTFVVDITEKKELERLKEDVDRIMRHDLKQPLSAIMGFPFVLSAKGNLDKEQLKILGIIKDAAKNMLKMIDSSLDMFKMETGKYNYQPQQIDALKIIGRIIEQNASLLSMKKISHRIMLNGEPFTKGKYLMVLSEKNLFSSMFSNLIVNAIEASPEENGILIEISEPDLITNEVIIHPRSSTDETTIHPESNTDEAIIHPESSTDETIIHPKSIADEKNIQYKKSNTPKSNKSSISIAIHNKGSVPEEMRKNFFGKYLTHGKKKGTGLGTYSAKLMAKVMGYEIEMETCDETDTTCIRVLIPMRENE